MRRGEIYRAAAPSADPRRYRVYAVVSRAEFLDSAYSTAVCVPVYSQRTGLATEVRVGEEEGLKHPSALRCDEVTSVPRVALRDFVGTLSPERLRDLDAALAIALDLDMFARDGSD